MHAGRLTEKIEIYERTNSINDFGDVTTSYEVFKDNVYCRILHIGTPSAGASEYIDNMQELGEMKVEFECRWINGVKFDMQVKWNEAWFDIYSIIPFGRREGMRIRATRRDHDAGSNPFSNA
jgi:head-tail adaptor